MIRVGVFGAGGRMGTTVCQAVAADPDLELVAAVDPFHAGLDLRQVTGIDLPLQMAAGPEALLDAEVEVAVDFTQVDAARENLTWLAGARHPRGGRHHAASTSDDVERFAALFTRSNCVIAPNFAIGAVLMMRFAELAAPYFETAEIIELHHDQKIDAPSGTAMATAQRMADASAEWAADPTTEEVVAGARGGRGAGRHPRPLGAAAGHRRPPGGAARHHRPDAHDPPRHLRPVVVHARRRCWP